MIHHLTYGTKVQNPCKREGRSGYTQCCHCGQLYTNLGISRHWAKCPAKTNPHEVKEEQSDGR
jgi:hypothetical protein